MESYLASWLHRRTSERVMQWYKSVDRAGLSAQEAGAKKAFIAASGGTLIGNITGTAPGEQVYGRPGRKLISTAAWHRCSSRPSRSRGGRSSFRAACAAGFVNVADSSASLVQTWAPENRGGRSGAIYIGRTHHAGCHATAPPGSNARDKVPKVIWGHEMSRAFILTSSSERRKDHR